MIRTRVCIAGIAALCALITAQSQATVLYTQTTARNPFVGDGGGPDIAVVDDVLVDNTINPLLQSFAVKKVTFGIIRDAGAPAVNITGYYGTTTTPVNPGDFPTLNSPITNFGSASLATYGGANTSVVNAVIGDGTNTLFTVTPNFTDQPGFGEFAIGLQFSIEDNRNSWAVVDAPDNLIDSNLDGEWVYTFADQSSFATALGTDLDPIYTTFVMTVEGSFVPEPSSLTLLAIGALGMARRRRTAY